MTRLAMISLFLGQLCLGSPDTQLVAPGEFFHSILGTYEVSLAGGHEAKPDTKSASAVIEEGEAILTFPYCPPKVNETDPEVCDPGYRYFPLETTKVEQSLSDDGHPLYSLTTQEDESFHRYTWEFHDNEIIFVDTQYLLLSGQVIVLEFRAQKVSESPTPGSPSP